MAVGGTQYELLGPSAERDVEAPREAGFGGQIAVYAPTVLTDDEDAIPDAVGEYAARRKPVRDALPADAPTGADASGRAREVSARPSATTPSSATSRRSRRASRDSKPRGPTPSSPTRPAGSTRCSPDGGGRVMRVAVVGGGAVGTRRCPPPR